MAACLDKNSNGFIERSALEQLQKGKYDPEPEIEIEEELELVMTVSEILRPLAAMLK